MSLDEAVWEADVGKVSEAMRLALGVEVTTLRYVSYSVSKDAHQIDAIYVLESQPGVGAAGRRSGLGARLWPTYCSRAPSTGSLPRIWPRLRATIQLLPTLGARSLSSRRRRGRGRSWRG